MESGMLVDLEHPALGRARTTGIPIKLSATPGSVRMAAPMVGEHSAAVLSELGLSASEVRALVADGTVVALDSAVDRDASPWAPSSQNTLLSDAAGGRPT